MKRVVCSLLLAASMATRAGAQSAPSGSGTGEDLARKLYENGLRFMSRGNPTEALRDFNDVVRGYPTSSVADEALVEIAQHHLDVSHDLAAAQTAIDVLLEKYRTSDSAPMSYVLSGRVGLMKGLTPATVDRALSDFERVNMFGGTDVLPVAMYYAGETLALVRRHEEALQRYQQVVTDYPGSMWAARASIGAARSFVQIDQPDRAMAALQRASTYSPGTPEAAHALALNTLLYRLRVRAGAQQAPYAFADKVISGADGKLRDVNALRMDPAGHLFAVQKAGASVYDSSGKFVRAVSALSPREVFFNTEGRAVFVQRGALQPSGGTLMTLATPKQDGSAKPLEEINAAVMTSSRELLVADASSKSVIRFSDTGKFGSVFAPIDADRLALDWLDGIAALDREAKAVAVFNREGKPLYRIQGKGTAYELRNPVDIAFDGLGHLYILDRSGERSALMVFSPSGRFLALFASPPNSAGTFREPQALALDRVGRLYIYDERNERVQVYK